MFSIVCSLLITQLIDVGSRERLFFFRSGDLTSDISLVAGAGICSDGSGTLGESLWITGNREIGSSLVQAKPCQGSLRVETARSPRVPATSEPGDKPVVIDVLPGFAPHVQIEDVSS